MEDSEKEGEECIQLIVPQLDIKCSKSLKKGVPIWIDRPYHVWRDNFQKDRCCPKKHVKREFFIAAYPVLILNVALILYLYFGALVFLRLNTNNETNDLGKLILFCFTTIATIGYGDVYPVDLQSKIACMLYCVIGIPLLLTTISTNGRILVDIYNIINQSLRPKSNQVEDLPWFISLSLLIFHCVLGGFIFSCWIDHMTFIDAVYFSFISISTIGFGDLTPTPETWVQYLVIITFLATGVGIMTTFFGSLQNTVVWIHNMGRKWNKSEDAEIWFGGNMMTVKELVTLVADQFQCTPEKLRHVLRDLDRILEVACNQTNEEINENEDKMEENTCLLKVVTNEKVSVKTPSPQSSMKKKAVFLTPSSSFESSAIPDENQSTVRSTSGISQKSLPKDTEKAIQALGAIQHHLNKPSTRAKSRTPPVRRKPMLKNIGDSPLCNPAIQRCCSQE